MSADLKPIAETFESTAFLNGTSIGLRWTSSWRLQPGEKLCSLTAAQAKIAALEAERDAAFASRDSAIELANSRHTTARYTMGKLDAAVARVAELRQAAQAVITAYDKACLEKYDEQCWDAFAGVDPLRAAIGSASSAAGEAT